MFRRMTFAKLIPAPVNTASRLSTASEMRRHVAGKLRRSLTVHRGLAGAEQDALPAFDDLALVESELLRPCPRVHCRALHHASSPSSGHGTTRSVGSGTVAHPRMYSDDDPYLAELRDLCLSFPESCEVEAWGRPTFRAGK